MKTLLLIACALAATVGASAVVIVSVVGDEREPLLEVPGGDAGRGKQAIAEYGCGACHQIPDVHSTEDYIGPPLAGLRERRYIAGNEPNRPDVLIRWIQDPQEIEPGTVMPDLGVDERTARDIAAYLYSLR